jgi:hypothetical protein
LADARTGWQPRIAAFADVRAVNHTCDFNLAPRAHFQPANNPWRYTNAKNGPAFFPAGWRMGDPVGGAMSWFCLSSILPLGGRCELG